MRSFGWPKTSGTTGFGGLIGLRFGFLFGQRLRVAVQLVSGRAVERHGVLHHVRRLVRIGARPAAGGRAHVRPRDWRRICPRLLD